MIIKKYSKNVNKENKDQLINDVDRDASVHGGLFAAITSGIAKQDHGDILFTKEHKPILFLSLMGMTEEARLEVLKLGIILLDKYVNLSGEEEKTDLVEKIKKIFYGLSSEIDRYKNILKSAQSIVEDAKIGIKNVEILLRDIQVK